MSGTNLFDLTGKTALVTGCRAGLGLGMAKALASAGADIVGADYMEMGQAQAEIEAMGRRFHGVVADFGKPIDFHAMVAKIEADFAPVDILINNAGIIRRADVLEFTEEDWDAVMNINIRAAFFIAQAVAKRIVARGVPGRIISTASLLAFQGGIRVPSYTASKHGIAGITKLLANELAGKGITANAIAPGYMATDNTTALRADAVRERQIVERIPAGRWGLPEDLATTVLFLASPHSGYVNGIVVPVDGGWLAR
ncbi:2-dehydro-3-deoxy-D-gluconate 5-dehydrogenase KduD [Siculibacillus lacustris]|uniref:2-dehydro-3-deoxy-D-gluconate 5-dehydrogenase KduD n=1 Tax=Siculibacillus lacustris TaxID=1549641 RepID=A0A4Q9VN05_9HYPH|nr:2-dehydro-3-deoxy-D-gluconate 5-dehydrogenase KduD [Siculibacillus lacustris]TBW37020.1 2-dehydro-3-deoxy-D-gluconate 5-dehydrogenase KduD [Siculibacillus lacustris]